MRILLCGASGFIGRHVHQALTRAGHVVVPTASSPRPGHLAVDFTRDTDPATWVPRLDQIDAVVNAVGVLRDSQTRPIEAVHAATPTALFQACAQAGVRRVIHISALGLNGSPTRYATTKLEAEKQLAELNRNAALDGVIVRPSVVFGRGGASSELFMNLARSPLLLLPQPVIQTRIQLIAVTDLAELVSRLLDPSQTPPDAIAAVGPQALTIAQFVELIRSRLGHPRAWRAPLPDWLTRLSASVGDHLPFSPWCSETLAMLSHDNVADAEPVQQWLGRPPIPPQSFSLQKS